MKNSVINLRFLLLCSLTFLAVCNVSIFFNFHAYLLSTGFSTKKAGFLVGLYSLTAMFMYATVSRRINLGNTQRSMLVGVMTVAGCGIAYTFAVEFWSLAFVRMVHGAGIFLIMASCMVVLVNIIPAEKTGFAFSIYSIALLAPYSIMPAFSEILRPYIESPTTLYMMIGCLLVPSAILIPFIQPDKKIISIISKTKEMDALYLVTRKVNLFRKTVFTILLINSGYFTLFSGLFYLFEGFAIKIGLSNPGFFFTVQMGVMIVIRSIGGGIFDTFSKVLLVHLSLVITGTGFICLYIMPTPEWALLIAVIFGIGMGLCIPPLNSLMYLVSEPGLRGYNANMMMFALNLGTFAGPFVGSLIIDVGGYDLFLLLAALMTVCGSGFLIVANPAKEIGVDISHELIDSDSTKNPCS